MLLFADKMYTAPSGMVYNQSLPFKQQVNTKLVRHLLFAELFGIPLVFFYKNSS